LEEIMKSKDHLFTVVACAIVAIFLTSCSTSGRLRFFEPMPPMAEEKVEAEIREEAVMEEIVIPQYSWGVAARDFNGKIGERFTIELPPGGQSQTIWGTAIYTDDSSIGTAAVHMGLITFAEGGTVTFEIREGIDSYLGYTRNGVTSLNYDSWEGSFVFIGPQGNAIIM
jgi:hypothetical protein